MYYLILIVLSLASIIGGWQHYPSLILIGGLFLGHALTEALNDPTD